LQQPSCATGDLSKRQRAIIERVSRSRTLPQRLVERATMVVAFDDGVSGTEQAARMGVDVQRTRQWRRRWAAAAPAIDDVEEAGR